MHHSCRVLTNLLYNCSAFPVHLGHWMFPAWLQCRGPLQRGGGLITTTATEAELGNPFRSTSSFHIFPIIPLLSKPNCILHNAQNEIIRSQIVKKKISKIFLWIFVFLEEEICVLFRLGLKAGANKWPGSVQKYKILQPAPLYFVYYARYKIILSYTMLELFIHNKKCKNETLFIL